MPAGRPSLFRPEFIPQARKLALLGATDAEVAAFFEVSESTIDKWKAGNPAFLRSLKQGKISANAKVATRLYRRALGYSHKAEKIITVARGANLGSEVVRVPYIERYPPDTVAAIFWLKNRESEKWRDRIEVADVSDPSKLSDAELDKRRKDVLKLTG